MILKHMQSNKGQAVVEMTFGFLLFFTMFMAIVEFSHLLYAKVTLQHALGTAGRYMVTGRTGQDSSGSDISRDQMIHNVFCANVIAAAVPCPNIGANFEFTCLDNGGVCLQPGGGPEQTVTVTVRLAKPTLMPFFSRFFPAGGVPFQLSTTWKNEPFQNS
jgi:Flp pilus assembly protein TadG